MSFSIRPTIWCDFPHCGKGYRIRTAMTSRRRTITVTETREEAAQKGWRYMPGVISDGPYIEPADLCPSHSDYVIPRASRKFTSRLKVVQEY